MNTARIVALTEASAACGIAAYLASGSDRQAEPSARAHLSGMPSLAARTDADFTARNNRTEDRTSKPGGSVRLARASVLRAMAAQR